MTTWHKYILSFCFSLQTKNILCIGRYLPKNEEGTNLIFIFERKAPHTLKNYRQRELRQWHYSIASGLLYFMLLPGVKQSVDAAVGKTRRRRNYMFWKMCLTLYFSKGAVSFLCVTYATQTASDGAWKVRKGQCQQVRVGLAPPQTGTHCNNVYIVIMSLCCRWSLAFKRKKKKNTTNWLRFSRFGNVLRSDDVWIY